jgi:putative hydrolase of the HAD superfamily
MTRARIRRVNVVFDLGGVLVQWKPEELVARAFPDPAVRELARREIMMHPDWLEIDRGTLTFEQAAVRAAERTGLHPEVTRRFIMSIPAALTAHHDTIELLYRVKAAGNAVYCLSNMPGETFAQLERDHDFWDAFDGLVVSYRIGHCKPEPAIYEHLLKTFDLDPRETVFIDDVPVNVEAAEALGIRGILFRGVEATEAALRAIGAL